MSVSGDPPQGYLGASARIRRGPAPELVEAGYELELSHAPLLHRGLGLADLAHVLALAEQGVIPAAAARALVAGVLGLDGVNVAELTAEARYGDLYNLRERWLEERIGTAAGWLAAGRPRREAGRIAFRIALRERVLDLADAIADFASALTELAARHAATTMADYTYLQVAQPTTFGHYLLSFAYPALRDGDRVAEAHAWVNRSPAGAGGVAGSRFPVDRRRLAALLGFDGIIEHTRDGIWQADGLVSLVGTAALAATNASRLAEDLEIYGSDEFGFVRLADEFCRASVLMPQKRNPYALAVIRGGAGTLAGRATGLLATQRTPSARTDNLLYAYGETCGAVELATRLLRLAAAVTAVLEVDVAACRRAAGAGFSQAADLADAIALSTGLDYRSAYRAIGRAVAVAVEDGRGPEALDPASLDRAAREVLGTGLTVDDALVQGALDPVASLATRTVAGGAAPEPMAVMLEQCRGRVAARHDWARAARARASESERALAETAAGDWG